MNVDFFAITAYDMPLIDLRPWILIRLRLDSQLRCMHYFQGNCSFKVFQMDDDGYSSFLQCNI